MRRATAGALALVGLLSAGCGTTVSGSPSTLRDSGLQSAAQGAVGASAAGQAGAAAVSGPSSSQGAATSTGPAVGVPGQSTGTAVAGSTVAATGPLQIGVMFESNLGAAYTSAGLKGASSENDDQIRADIQTIVTDINNTGGIAGRKLAVVYYGADPSSGTFDQQNQAACSSFTEDHKVFAVVSGANAPSESLVACLAKHGVPLVWEYQYLVSRQTFAKYAPYLYQPAMLDADRLAVFVDQLHAGGFFGNAAKVGIIRYDEPNSADFSDRVLRPRLAAYGEQVVDEEAISPLTGESGAGQVESQLGAAVVQFRSKGVTHVLFSPSDGVLPWLFMTSAESQGYRPRYALTSEDVPNFVALNAPAAQLAGAMGVGWTPGEDLPNQRAYPQGNPAQAECLRVVGTATSAPGKYLRYCDGLFFLRAALAHVSAFTPQAMAAAVSGLGSAFDPAWTFSTRFGPGRADGVAAVRRMAFQSGCGCFTYITPPIAVS